MLGQAGALVYWPYTLQGRLTQGLRGAPGCHQNLEGWGSLGAPFKSWSFNGL